MHLEDPRESELTIKIVGSRWKWQYQYLNQGINFFSNIATPYSQISTNEKKNEWYLLEVDKPLILPINKKIRFLVTSNDVIHSWWVPELGVKRDAMPGFMNEAWAIIEKPGIYRGQCAELCGINHAYMPIVVQAVNDDEFQAWVNKQPKVADNNTQTNQQDNKPDNAASETSSVITFDKTMTIGQAKYEQICVACHKSDGRGLPPLYPPLRGSSVAVGSPITRHIDIVLNGVPGTAMQAYKYQLTDEEIAAIVTYERNSWENNTGDFVKASDVTNVRQSNNQTPKMVNKAQVGGLQ